MGILQEEFMKKAIDDGILSDNETVIRNKKSGQIVAIIKQDNINKEQPINNVQLMFDGSEILQKIIDINNEEALNKLELNYEVCINRFKSYLSSRDDMALFNLTEKCLDLISQHNIRICKLLTNDFINENTHINDLDIVVNSFTTIIYLYKYLNIIYYKKFHAKHEMIDGFLKKNYTLIQKKFENLLIPEWNYGRKDLYFYKYLFVHKQINTLKEYSYVDSRFDKLNIIEVLMNLLLEEAEMNHNNYYNFSISMNVIDFNRTTIDNANKLYNMLIKLKNAIDNNNNFSENGFLDENYELQFFENKNDVEIFKSLLNLNDVN